MSDGGWRRRRRATCWVADAVSRLGRSGTVVATVVGFPLGAGTTKAKAAEARLAVGAGAGELDMVMAIGQAKSGEWRCVEDDIRRVVEAAGAAPVKVILESAALEPVDVAAASLVARANRLGTSGAAAMAAILGPSAPPLKRLIESSPASGY